MEFSYILNETPQQGQRTTTEKLDKWPAVGQGTGQHYKLWLKYKCIRICQGNLWYKNPYDGGAGKRIEIFPEKPMRMANETVSCKHLSSPKVLKPAQSNICQVGNLPPACGKQISKLASIIPAPRSHAFV